jgi:hypothetical protein
MSLELDRLAGELTEVIDGVAAAFGDAADPTVNGELDCDPTEVVLPTLAGQGWQAHDRSTPRELIARFSRDGADFTIHVARASHAVAIIGSTRPVPA